MKMPAAVLALGLLLPPAAVAAQVPGDDVVDRLVAIVGDSVIVRTQILEELQRMQLNGTEIPPAGTPAYESMFRGVLDQFIDQLLVIQAVEQDSLIQIDDATIDQRVADQIDQLAEEFGGQPALRQALVAEGLTLAEYREMMRSQARIGQIQQLFYQSRLRDATPIEVTEAEMLQQFQQERSTFQQRPKTVTFRQVVIQPEASQAAKDTARAEAERLLSRIRAGEPFDSLAREYSDDAGTAEVGGDLGWFRRGRMVREFEDAAFGLLAGEVSPVVETEFGFHIIKVERFRQGERQARHILIMPEQSDADLQKARDLANDVRARAEAGESMVDLLAEHREDVDELAPDSLTVTFDQIGELGPAYAPLRTASGGDILGPIEHEMPSGEQRFTVVRVLEVREAGAYTFEDLRGAIASRLQQEKQIERLHEQLRANTHIEIRM
jgi:peptidyl-prolyl cis-trans isomerase SurA